ncbi:MAG TPA: hypothetical protein VF169_01650 [Albitalea sp.]|uniref:hypothetical protein n=1 Tax=Piscinibacter sp. TaxID=1903157 RepID=UPI002ED2D001
MNKHRRVYLRPIVKPMEPDNELPCGPSGDDPAPPPMAVRVEVPPDTGLDELTDTEWSAFMGLRPGST